MTYFGCNLSEKVFILMIKDKDRLEVFLFINHEGRCLPALVLASRHVCS